MSEEERVMPFEKAQDVFPIKVTPRLTHSTMLDELNGNDKRVMPFKKAQDVFPIKVTPTWGKGALGTWRSQDRSTGKPG